MTAAFLVVCGLLIALLLAIAFFAVPERDRLHPRPGSPLAQRRGCTCPVDQPYGWCGEWFTDIESCPLHHAGVTR